MGETEIANAGMLVLARESRELTQTDVARAMTKVSGEGVAPVSQGYVSRAEKGLLAVTGDRLECFAQALGYPAELLCLDAQVAGVGVGLVHHRKRASLSAPALRRLHADLALTRVQIEGMAVLADVHRTAVAVPQVAVDDLTPPRDAAKQVRRALGLARGPVQDLTAAIEAVGCVVVVRDLDTELLDAVSQWPDEQQPLVLVNSRAPGDRRRFSLAHELGHLVMHQMPGNASEQEKQADEFASELLMPAADIREAFTGAVDLGRLAELKKIWRVSMAALLRRAYRLNAVTEWQYRTLTIEMSALGYRTCEPVEVPQEEPQRVRRMVDRLLVEQEVSVMQAAACARLLPEDFLHLYLDNAGTSSPSPA